jgi:hypothetical protein
MQNSCRSNGICYVKIWQHLLNSYWILMSRLRWSVRTLLRACFPGISVSSLPTRLPSSLALRIARLSSTTNSFADVNARQYDPTTDISEKDFKPKRALLVRKVTRYEYEKTYLKPGCSEEQLKEYVSYTNQS